MLLLPFNVAECVCEKESHVTSLPRGNLGEKSPSLALVREELSLWAMNSTWWVGCALSGMYLLVGVITMEIGPAHESNRRTNDVVWCYSELDN